MEAVNRGAMLANQGGLSFGGFSGRSGLVGCIDSSRSHLYSANLLRVESKQY